MFLSWSYRLSASCVLGRSNQQSSSSLFFIVCPLYVFSLVRNKKCKYFNSADFVISQTIFKVTDIFVVTRMHHWHKSSNIVLYTIIGQINLNFFPSCALRQSGQRKSLYIMWNQISGYIASSKTTKGNKSQFSFYGTPKLFLHSNSFLLLPILIMWLRPCWGSDFNWATQLQDLSL